MSSIHTILHPTDFSANSRYAFQTACSLAKQNNARLILLHVIPPSAAPLLTELPANPLRSAESQPSLQGRFTWPQPTDLAIQVEHRVAEGDAPAEILSLARMLGCDLIVLGTHGRTGLSRFLAGSVAEEVLRKADCPVLAVKTPLQEVPPPATVAETAKPGDIVDVRPLGASLADTKTRTVVRTDELEIIRLILPAWKELPEHKTKGPLVVHCLQGRVAFSAVGKQQVLQAGDLLYLPMGEPHSIRGIEDACLLLSIFLPKRYAPPIRFAAEPTTPESLNPENDHETHECGRI
jgi:nucleotide-binding universal stress UspA family protein/quercetin dioxygenase-like cupin family protein